MIWLLILAISVVALMVAGAADSARNDRENRRDR